MITHKNVHSNVTTTICYPRASSPASSELSTTTSSTPPPPAGLQTDDSKLRSKLFGRSLSNKERSSLPKSSPEPPPTLSQSTETLVNEDVGGPGTTRDSQTPQVTLPLTRFRYSFIFCVVES